MSCMCRGVWHRLNLGYMEAVITIIISIIIYVVSKYLLSTSSTQTLCKYLRI